jgi:hypothetical protein
MDLNNAIISLCVKGTQAEFSGKMDEARALYWQAWQNAQDDFEACIAAHYVARFQNSPEESLHWNEESLRRAELVKDDRVKPFYPSLYLNLGQSHEKMGHAAEARQFYDLAAQLGLPHQQM